VFCIDVPLGDPDIVEFMSAGVCEIDFLGTKKTARLMALLLDEKSLRRQLREAVWAPAKLKPSGSRIKAGTKVVAHCHGVFLLPDGKTLCVAVGRTKPTAPDAWIPAGLKADADALLLEHQSKVAEFDEAIEPQEEGQRGLLRSQQRHEEVRRICRSAGGDGEPLSASGVERRTAIAFTATRREVQTADIGRP
jgi:hypothetical protein